MQRSYLPLLPVMAALMAFPVHAASFNCKKASSKVEKTICADAGLLKLDDQLSGAFRDAKAVNANPEPVIQWQKLWLENSRDLCTDAVCLKQVYTAHLGELSQYARLAKLPASVSGLYVRYLKGRPDRNAAGINVFEVGNNRVRLFGSALWAAGGISSGNVNIGEVGGVFSVDGKQLRYQDSDAGSCRLTLRFKPAALTVSEETGMCGGQNVHFSGDYQRTGGKG